MKITKYIKLLLSILAAWILVHTAAITWDGLRDDLRSADVGVVPGNKVESDGTPSRRLQGRLDRSLELYQGKYFKKILVSGGIDPGGHDEAIVMKSYLVSKGIPKEDVIVDSRGSSTILTAKNAAGILSAHHHTSAIAITQFYHVSRTRLAFSKAGLGDAGSAHARVFEARDLYSLAREFIAFYWYLLFG